MHTYQQVETDGVKLCESIAIRKVYGMGWIFLHVLFFSVRFCLTMDISYNFNALFSSIWPIPFCKAEDITRRVSLDYLLKHYWQTFYDNRMTIRAEVICSCPNYFKVCFQLWYLKAYKLVCSYQESILRFIVFFL